MRHESSCFCIILPRADLNEDQNEDQNEELRNRNGHGWNRTWIGSRERFSGRGLSWSFFDHILSGAVEKQAGLVWPSGTVWQGSAQRRHRNGLGR